MNNTIKTCPHRGFPLAYGKPCQYHGRFPGEQFCSLSTPEDAPLSPAILDEIEDDVGEQFWVHVQEVRAPFYLWMQNTADPNHLPFVHSDFNSVFEGTKPKVIRFSSDKRISMHAMPVRNNVAESYSRIFKQTLQPFFFHFLVFPKLSVTSFLNVFYSMEVAEPSSTGCVVETRFYTRKGLKVPQALLDAAIKANTQVLREDKAVVETWAPTAKSTGNWLPGEERIKVYCELLKEHQYV